MTSSAPPAQRLICGWCGTVNPPQAIYCGKCGGKLSIGDRAGADSLPLEESPPPSAALEGSRLAGFGPRAGAFLLDALVITLLQGIVSATLRDTAGLATALVLLVPWAYSVPFIALMGQTPGKKALGIKVVNLRGQLPGYGRALLREVIGKFASGFVLGLGYLWVAWDRDKQAWHDHIASTYVIRGR